MSFHLAKDSAVTLCSLVENFSFNIYLGHEYVDCKKLLFFSKNKRKSLVPGVNLKAQMIYAMYFGLSNLVGQILKSQLGCGLQLWCL